MSFTDLLKIMMALAVWVMFGSPPLTKREQDFMDRAMNRHVQPTCCKYSYFLRDNKILYLQIINLM